MAIAATWRDADARDVARAIAEEARAVGIQVNFAPVVDLDTNPDNPVIGKLGRSFSSDPKKVTAHALEFIKAHHAEGILCALKHFPGHGSSKADSHLGFVDVTRTWSPAPRVSQADGRWRRTGTPARSP